MELTANEKAKQLINMYYTNAGSQLEAIEIAERVVLGTMCQQIDSLDGHVNHLDDYDMPLIKSSINQLKSWQQVAAELENIKIKMAV